MLGSAGVYSGLVLTFVGLLMLLRRRTRRRGLAAIGAGLLLIIIGFLLPAPLQRAPRSASRLDEFMPAWQFHEEHELRIAAPPERVYDALLRVRADEITLFNALTWIRRGGRRQRENILNAGRSHSLIDVATHSGFVRLADDAPRELVIGMAVIGGPAAAEHFPNPPRPDTALAAMNFRVAPDGAGGSMVTTETRIFANSDRARRRFSWYWRLIYPGSSLIRYMWLRAIERRALTPQPRP
ncbi:MAG TPA: hypothetical protein VGR02_01405 [Thermoanaerobaculia bacterium]|jgi:hypothetical protein|nr:hypothetical protein [Thermoanaerobaculia bacterium]